jgi:glycosyltransferase involved in cell wall biosynthesis
VTIHDLSFEDPASTMGARDRWVFRRVVPRAARAARRVLTVSERSRSDIVSLYGIDPSHVLLTPNAVDPAFTPDPSGTGAGVGRRYALCVGAVQPRKNQEAALAAARKTDLDLVVVGPVLDEHVAARLREGGARLEGYVETGRLVELYRGASCLIQASRYEGFGLPVIEAMACGAPVVVVDEPALVEVAGDAAVVVSEAGLADGIVRALAERARLVEAGLERARSFSWEASARVTVRAYREALGR